MFKHVLVPIDGSRFSERAIDYAAQLLAGSAGELSLVIVVPNYLAAGFPGSNLPGAVELENHHKQLAEQLHSPEGSRGLVAFGRAGEGRGAERLAS